MTTNFADFKAKCDSKTNLYELFNKNNLIEQEGSICEVCQTSILILQNRKKSVLGKVLKCSNRTCRN